jgi:carboxypeptidase PM20D1
MTRAVKRSLAASAVVVVGLISVAAVVVARALTARSIQVVVEPVPRISIDDGAIERLAGAIRLPTVSRSDGSHSDFAALEGLHRHLEVCFPKVHETLTREIVNGQSLLFTWKGQDPAAKPILLMAHMDVVPVEPRTEASWTHGPFSGDLADGFIWGRGTLDDKVGVMAILEAVEILVTQAFRPRQTILLAFGHDEEIGGQAGAGRIAALLKSRGVHLEYVLDEGMMVTQGVIPGLDRPAALIGIAEKGYASVELRAISPGGHSSMPPPQTAAGIVAAAVVALESHPMPAALDGPVARLFDHLAPEMPLWSRLPLVNRWLFNGLIVRQLEKSPTTNATVRTTTAATIIEGGVKDNVLPASARAVVNFRIKPGDTVNDVLTHVKKVVADGRVEIKLLEPGAGQEPSPQSSASAAGFRTVERTIRQVTPDSVVAPALVIGATDTRHYQDLADDVYRFLPFVLQPDDLRRIHGTDERISVEGYRDCVRFYVQLLINESRESG